MTREHEPISLLEARVTRGEAQAREMLHRLEAALVRAGYTRDGRYSKRWPRPLKGKSIYGATVLYWEGGKLYYGSYGRPQKGSVDELSTYELLFVAEHLIYLVDALEENTRHLHSRLVKALDDLDAFIKRIEAEPRPTEGEPVELEHDHEGEPIEGNNG